MSSASSCSSIQSTDSWVEFKKELVPNIDVLLNELGIQHKNLHYLAEGSWHVVYAFEIINSQDEMKASYIQAVIRIATSEDLDRACSTTLDHAAILQFVRRHFDNVPTLLTYDATTQNILERPYTVQTRLPGVTLESTWAELDLHAKFEITEQLADFLLKCKSIRFPACGQFGCVTKDGQVSEKLELGIRDYESNRIEKLVSDHPSPFAKYKEYFQSFLSTNIQKCESFSRPLWLARDRALLTDIGEIFDEMVDMPEFQPYLSSNANDAVLDHVDLHPGNILVEAYTASGDSNERWRVSGIIDWDGGESIPIIQANQSPAFLWQSRMYDEWDLAGRWPGNFDHLPREYRDVFDLPHGALIKKHFDTYMESRLASTSGSWSTWQEDTYGLGVWIRRVTDFCLNGFHDDGSYIDCAIELIDEWRQKMHRPQQCELEIPNKAGLEDARDVTCVSHSNVLRPSDSQECLESGVADVIGNSDPPFAVDQFLHETANEDKWVEIMPATSNSYDAQILLQSIFCNTVFVAGATGLLAYKLYSLFV